MSSRMEGCAFLVSRATGIVPTLGITYDGAWLATLERTYDRRFEVAVVASLLSGVRVVVLVVSRC